jgi:hypothetical protein
MNNKTIKKTNKKRNNESFLFKLIGLGEFVLQ